MKSSPELSVPGGLSSVLSAAGVESAPVPELRPGGTPRAPRFAVRVPVRFRFPDIGEGFSEDWHSGETENISKSGVAFRTALSDVQFATVPPSADGVRLELVLAVPGGEAHRAVVRCNCTLVRVVRGFNAGSQTHVAAHLRSQLQSA